MAEPVGTSVTWDWGNGEASGTIKHIYHESVTRTLKGREVTRNGSDDNPAYLIEQKDGSQILKLSSELK